MNKKSLLLLAVVLVVAAVAVITLRHGSKTTNGLKVSGTIEVTSTELSFKVGGRMVQRLVDEGEMVASGQAVATLESRELKDELAGRSADLRAAQAGLTDLQAGSRREEIAQGEAALARMKAEADRLARDAVRADALFAREVIALKDVESARAARDASAAALHEAEQHLKLLKAGPRPDAVLQARARTEAATASRSLAEERLSQSRLISPVSGLVLAKHAEPGEMVAAGAPVVTVGALENVWLRAYIPETELGRVRVGQAARVMVDTWPGRAFMGRISFISPQAEFTPKNVQTEKERIKLVYRIKITLDNPKMELKPGMPADATIEVTP